jgi:protein involved in polysaccharide export with SLBB domain
MQGLLSIPRLRAVKAFLFCLMSVVSRPAFAQVIAQAPVAQATRSELEARASSLERALADSAKGDARRTLQMQLQRLRQRLTEGDFTPGDRIYLRIRGDSTVSGDTVIVREGSVLSLGQFGDVPLRGVLRSELHDRVAAQVGRLLREPDVSVGTLVRIAVFGQVTRPGYYSMAPEAPIGDALMVAGGPTPDADLERIELKRDSDVLVAAPAMRQAMARGVTFDQLDVRPGDAITVAQKKQHNYSLIIQTSAVILGSLTALLALSRR